MSGEYIASLAGWYFLPNLVTGWLQSFYYGITIRAGEPHPPPGSPPFNKHRKYIYTLVITAYLLFNVYNVDWQIRRGGDFYADFGIPLDADEKALSRTLRRLLAQAHPDKAAARHRDQAEAMFINVKTAYDTLVDPIKRFAYERFGPDMLEWKNCKTVRDYVLQGAQNSLVTMASTLVVMLIAQTLGQMRYGRYWRYVTLASLLVFEIHTMTRPQFPRLLTKIINPFFTFTGIHPPYLPFQLIRLARQTAFSFFIAVNQLAPAWSTTPTTPQQETEVQNQLLSQLRNIIGLANQDSQRLLALEHAPYAGNARSEALLKDRLVEWLVTNEVRNDPGVSAAMRRVIERRNREDDGEDEII